MLKTQLKRNKKGNPPFYHSPLHLSSMIPPCSHDSCHLSGLYTSQTWPCDPALSTYFTPACHSPNPELAFFYFEYGLETHDSVCKCQQYDCHLAAVTNFIQPYLHQFFDDSYSLNGYRKPLKIPFDRYQSCFETSVMAEILGKSTGNHHSTVY